MSALITNDRGWARIAANPSAPRSSSLSLLDWKERWIDAGRKQIYGYAYEHEMRALLNALDALEGDIGLELLVERRGVLSGRAVNLTKSMEIIS